MTNQWLLKFNRLDDEQSHVLVRVTSRDSDELDLDLLATEGEEAYKGKLRRSELRSLRAKTYNGTESEWEAILRYTLLEGKVSAISQEQKKSLEVGASRQDRGGKYILLVSFHNRIDDITQRIGAIELTQASKAIQLFDWAALAAERNKTLESELATLSESTSGYAATISRLEAQLADLVKVKTEHEEQLIGKFVLLLNEKKSKIRDQQRVLQTASVDVELGRQLRATRDEPDTGPARRRSKRPAPNEDNTEDDESQAFETQADSRVKRDVSDQEIDSDRQTTPNSTDSEAVTEELPTRAKKPTPRIASPKSTRKQAATVSPSRDQPSSTGTGHNTRSQTQAKAPSPALEDDEETASEDDEL